jgi:hypothetical protein
MVRAGVVVGPVPANCDVSFEVDGSQTDATFEPGIVRITPPRPQWPEPHKIAIDAGSGQQEAIDAGSAGEPRRRPSGPPQNWATINSIHLARRLSSWLDPLQSPCH